jgi:UDP-N-acetyl-2-amino-2-deoxyglucuronate dehydrogenase
MNKLGGDIDVVNVLTESGSHARNCVELAKYQRHIVVEQPMALTLADADDMIRVCDDAGIKLFVVKQNAADPATSLGEE